MATLTPTEGPSTLTQTLLKRYSSEFTRATRAPFLKAAGNGLISRKTLSQWLSQDRLYGLAYISFIGCLLGRVYIPVELDSNRTSLEWRTAEMLTAALENILREQRFYDDVAGRYGLKLDEPSGGDTKFAAIEITHSYVNLFRSFIDPQKSLLEGMVVLWATEKCYLEAFSYALESKEGGTNDDLDGGALREEFIPNWTSKDFVDFVENIAGLLNELAVTVAEPDLASLQAWQEVLKLEEKFWPEI